MKMLKSTAAILTLLFCFNITSAQEEEMTPKKYENPEYYMVSYVKFHPGKSGEAKKIIDEYFIPTSQQAGTDGPVMHLNMITGEWDMMIVWHMKEGLESLNWEMSPDDIKWEKAFMAMAGGKEKGMEISKQWESYIKGSKSHLGRKHKPKPEKQ